MFLGSQRWPPPAWVWKAAAALTLLMVPLILLGTIGHVIFAIVVVVVVLIIVNRRLSWVDPDEEFRNSRPDE